MEGEEESGVPGDALINSMMAHSPAELQLFTAMDEERLQQDAQLAAQAGLPKWNRLLVRVTTPVHITRTSVH